MNKWRKMIRGMVVLGNYRERSTNHGGKNELLTWRRRPIKGRPGRVKFSNRAMLDYVRLEFGRKGCYYYSLRLLTKYPYKFKLSGS